MDRILIQKWKKKSNAWWATLSKSRLKIFVPKWTLKPNLEEFSRLNVEFVRRHQQLSESVEIIQIGQLGLILERAIGGGTWIPGIFVQICRADISGTKGQKKICSEILIFSLILATIPNFIKIGEIWATIFIFRDGLAWLHPMFNLFQVKGGH